MQLPSNSGMQPTRKMPRAADAGRGNLDPIDGSGTFWKVSGIRAYLEKKRERDAV